jgi:hypothetical protein
MNAEKRKPYIYKAITRFLIYSDLYVSIWASYSKRMIVEIPKTGSRLFSFLFSLQDYKMEPPHYLTNPYSLLGPSSKNFKVVS